jgi:hypothetical protein
MVAYAKSNYGVVLTLHEATVLHERWKKSWPVVVEYLDWIAQLVSGGSALVVHHKSNRWRGGCSYTVAANSHFQGMAADGAKRALWEVARRCYEKQPGSALYGCRPVNFVHDEIIMEAPLDRAHEAAEELAAEMVKAFNFFTPDVPVRASPVLMDRWSKKAKAVKDNSGRLQLWRYGQ